MLIFYFREALHTFRKTKLFSMFTVISLSISLLLVTASIVLFFASSKIDENLKKRIEANVFLIDSVKDNAIQDIKKEIYANDFILETKYISKDEAMKEFIRETGQDFRSLLDINPLPSYFKVTFNKNIDEDVLKGFILNLESNKNVVDVVIDYNLAITILNLLNSGKVVLFILTAFILLISVYLVYSSSKIYVEHQTVHFNTMKLVGSKLSTLKVPLLLRGVILGLLSAMTALIIFNVSVIMFHKFYPQFQFANILYFVNFMLLILGLIFGPLGTGIFSRNLSLKIENKK